MNRCEECSSKHRCPAPDIKKSAGIDPEGRVCWAFNRPLKDFVLSVEDFEWITSQTAIIQEQVRSFQDKNLTVKFMLDAIFDVIPSKEEVDKLRTYVCREA